MVPSGHQRRRGTDRTALIFFIRRSFLLCRDGPYVTRRFVWARGRALFSLVDVGHAKRPIRHRRAVWRIWECRLMRREKNALIQFGIPTALNKFRLGDITVLVQEYSDGDPPLDTTRWRHRFS